MLSNAQRVLSVEEGRAKGTEEKHPPFQQRVGDIPNGIQGCADGGRVMKRLSPSTGPHFKRLQLAVARGFAFLFLLLQSDVCPAQSNLTSNSCLITNTCGCWCEDRVVLSFPSVQIYCGTCVAQIRICNATDLSTLKFTTDHTGSGDSYILPVTTEVYSLQVEWRGNRRDHTLQSIGDRIGIPTVEIDMVFNSCECGAWHPCSGIPRKSSVVSAEAFDSQGLPMEVSVIEGGQFSVWDYYYELISGHVYCADGKTPLGGGNRRNCFRGRDPLWWNWHFTGGRFL